MHFIVHTGYSEVSIVMYRDIKLHLSPQFPIPPLTLHNAKGVWLTDTEGKRYFDASSGAVCVNIGHADESVIEAMRESVTRFTYAYPGQCAYEQIERLSAELCELGNWDASGVMFSNTGTGAIELAIACAREYHRVKGYPSRVRVLTAWTGYHGCSTYTLALSGHRRRRPPASYSNDIKPSFQPPYPGLHHVFNPQHICDERCADEVAEHIDLVGANEVAAVLIEPILGTTGGAMIPPPRYLARLRSHCLRTGVLLVYDEVLVGLGRAGSAFAFMNFPGAAPDLCVVSKGLGAGYVPISAVIVNQDVSGVLRSDGARLPLSGTMSGNPLGVATAIAVLRVLRELGVFAADTRGQAYRQRGENLGVALRQHLGHLPHIKEVRGCGYFYGVELVPGALSEVLLTSREYGLVLYPFNGFRSGGHGEGIIVAPPLTTTVEEHALLIDALKEVLCGLKTDPH